MSIKTIDFQQNILSIEDIDFLLNLPEVLKAKNEINNKNNGYVNFKISLNSSIKKSISEKLNLDLFNVESIPMRWIKGDTVPHIDRSNKPFEKTFLMYLTDSLGELIIDSNSYPISKGCGYSFSESLRHETINTGSEPRLLLGPMSEGALSVGVTQIYLYIRQSGPDIQESSDQTSWSTISSWPYYLAEAASVIFVTDITLTSANQYFITNNYNLIGLPTLNNDGNRPIITINGVTGYPGLIQNGTNINGGGLVNILNLKVSATNGSTLADNGGWIGQSYFGKGAPSNGIINCSSDGPIGSETLQGGGIVGSFAGSNGGQLGIISCSSSGDIGFNSGGIVGPYAGNTDDSPPLSSGATITCIGCWSTGNILSQPSGNHGGGGIFGQYAGYSAIAEATNCYSEGTIGNRCGGIYGRYAGRAGTAKAENCYSQGTIATDGGGIFGVYAGVDAAVDEDIPATNCYSSGTVTTSGNGIFGSSKSFGIDTNCYVANGTWSTVTAIANLTGTPPISMGEIKVGEVWIATILDQPYELRNMGYTPYDVNILGGESIINSDYSETIGAGSSSIPALISGRSYTILEIQDGDSGSYSTITMNSTTGSISTTPQTAPGTYTIFIRNTGSYYMSVVHLEVISDLCLPADAPILTDQGIVEIGTINKDIHTINGSKIKRITKSILLSDKVILIKKNGLNINYPNQDTIISKDHKFAYQNKLLSAEMIKNKINNKAFIREINYNKELMYNIELETYGLIKVNNLDVDTLNKPTINKKLLKFYINPKY